MRVAASVIALVGALMSLYVSYAAYRNGLSTGFQTPPAFFVIGFALAAAGIAASVFTWRRRRLGLWLLLAAALSGIAAWPWLVAGVTYLLGAVVSLISLIIARRAVATPR